MAFACVSACSRTPAPRRYQLEGQILAVNLPRKQLTIKHGDIPGLMPAMTMNYPVARPDLLAGRTAGELIKATLEVGNEQGTLVEITHVGQAPLADNTNEAAMAAGLLDLGDAAPDVTLIDQDNHPRAFTAWRGTPMLVTFIYTRCPLPNFCPLMDEHFATIARLGAADPALNGRFHLVTVTFDPDHDTPAVLAQHAAHLHADPRVWTFLTGDRAVIDTLAAQFGIGVLRDPQDPTQITHNLRTTLIGADGRLKRVYADSDWTPEQVMRDLRAELAAR